MRDVQMRTAVGHDTSLAWRYERAMLRFAACSDCGVTGVPLVPGTSDETGDLQFTCTDKRVCRWRSQTRSLVAAGVL